MAFAMEMPQNASMESMSEMPDCHMNLEKSDTENTQSCCNMMGGCDTNCMMQQAVLNKIPFHHTHLAQILNTNQQKQLIPNALDPLKRPPIQT